MKLKTLKFGFVNILALIIFLLVGCSSQNSASKAAKIIPDRDLKTFYGGCWWNWFNNPYCVRGGTNCPPNVGCPDSGWAAARCTICGAQNGTICQSGGSLLPDPGGCADESPNCIIVAYGYCAAMLECNPGGGDPPYPNCGTYSYCND